MIALIYFLLLSTTYAKDNGLCGTLVTARQTQDHTDRLIAFLQDLVERQILRVSHLNSLASNLEGNQITNPFSNSETLTKSLALIHSDAINRFLKNGQLDRKRLLDWTLSTLKEKGEVREEQAQTSEAINHDIYYKMKFNPVPAGEFKRGEINRKKITKLTNPFEMMSTPVTQHMWAMAMGGKNPSHFMDGDESISLKIEGNWVILSPDNPVENITWWSAVVYANRMSERMGYKPAHDLSEVKFAPGTSAEDGTLAVLEGTYKINAPGEDIYLTEGYRLPTAAEVEYVLKAAGQTKGKYHFNEKGIGSEEYAWSSINSQNRTHPVAELKPLKIGEHDFFDLPGNVWIWTHDSVDWPANRNVPDPIVAPTVDPQGAIGTHEKRLVVGGSYANHISQLASYSKNYLKASDSSEDVGVRLVRTLPK